jgi:hypothetical protein
MSLICPRFVGRSHLSEVILKSDFMAGRSLDPLSNVTRHPASAAYDRAYALAYPAVALIAEHKHVGLAAEEHDSVLRGALKGTREKALRLIARGDDEATFALSLAISHALDELAMKRLIMICRSICKLPPLDESMLIASARDSLSNGAANDRPLTIRIWRDPVVEVADYVRAVFAEPVGLSARATVLTMMRGTATGAST